MEDELSQVPRNDIQKEIEELPEKLVSQRDSDFFEAVKRELNANDPNLGSPLKWLFHELNHEKKKRKFVLPVSYKDFPKAKKASNLNAILFYIFSSALDIPPKYRDALLVTCMSFLGYHAKNVPDEFDLQLGEVPQTLLDTGEAFAEFFPAMVHIMMFVLCFCLSFILVWSLQPGLQMFFTLLLIAAPLFYFHQLWLKTSGVDVAYGSIKMPLIWFIISGALVLSLICCFLILLSIYISWRYVQQGRSRVKATEVSLDGLTEIFGGVN